METNICIRNIMKIKIFLLFIVLSFFNIAFASDSEICEREFKDKNYTRALQYCEKACSLNDGHGCAYLGVLYADGLGVKQNKKVSKEYFGKSCDLGFQDGCDDYRKLIRQGY